MYPIGYKFTCNHLVTQMFFKILLDWIGLDWIGLDWITAVDVAMVFQNYA